MGNTTFALDGSFAPQGSAASHITEEVCHVGGGEARISVILLIGQFPDPITAQMTQTA